MSQAKVSQQITNLNEAESLLGRIGDAMVALVNVFEEETRLVKAGKLKAASDLTPQKTELASNYLLEIETLKRNAPYLSRTVPSQVEELRKAHAAFRDILALNLKVVATAQSVAESIVRGATEDATKRVSPTGYGANGKMQGQPKTAHRPVVVSRSS
jgi:hypothetical protein